MPPPVRFLFFGMERPCAANICRKGRCGSGRGAKVDPEHSVLKALPGSGQAGSACCGDIYRFAYRQTSHKEETLDLAQIVFPAHRPAGDGVCLRRSGCPDSAGPLRLDLSPAAETGANGPKTMNVKEHKNLNLVAGGNDLRYNQKNIADRGVVPACCIMNGPS